MHAIHIHLLSDLRRRRIERAAGRAAPPLLLRKYAPAQAGCRSLPARRVPLDGWKPPLLSVGLGNDSIVESDGRTATVLAHPKAGEAFLSDVQLSRVALRRHKDQI